MEDKNSTPYLIDVDHTCKSFEDLHVLKDVTLKIKPKEVVVIIGPSGSGKSTLLRCMNGLETPTSGTVYFDGIALNSEDNLNKVRTEVGMVFQRFNLFPHMTVIKNIMLAPMKVRKVSKEEAYARGMKLLEKVGLKDKANAMPSQLSGGQQQRVAIARAIAARPPVILADEPTGNLDSASSREIMEILKGMHRSGETLILITHDNGIAAQARRVVRIMDGKIESDTINEEFVEEA